ncbi:MAG: acetylxylan esterase [Bacteroidota bacterium]|nr:acetylxylan esterase [Bacteroidota bacterium]
MNFKLLVLFCFLFLSGRTFCQVPDEVYKQPLKDVLNDIAEKYKVKLVYDDKNVKNVFVLYPSWRYRTDVKETLQNVLSTVDMVFSDNGNHEYTIAKFEYYRKPFEEGKKHLDRLLAAYPNLSDWEARKVELRKEILQAMELSPLPKKTPLNPSYTPKRVMDGYTVENVALETLPGVYLCGSLYKPLKGKGPFPAVLCPHGHFYNNVDKMILDERGRYRPDQQYRCAMLARMGAVVFSYDMFAWGESMLQVDKNEHRTGLALTMQTLNSMRVLDFLTSLPYVDSKRIGVTAASGGGTQTLLIAALDDRIAVSVPVVMVASHFFGGCPCESGLPIHSCTALGTNNAEIAAMASPRPQLVISDGSDWTQTVPTIEFPYMQKVYGLYGKAENVENVHLAQEGHDYGISKRMAMYEFMARKLGLNLNAVKDKNGKIDESRCTIEKHEAMLAFGKEGKLPADAVKGPEAIKKALKSLQ